eukprot:NODE_2036_length_517_cov_56.799145_g1660_i0.p1 GENE.NODE_2036_length_517_cov_56.799145_g1660_i0~~NODE_2036_length_517_cov_56.799145_g1660_i0.p1  ORF type:complete len:164 (+),score=39.64 NODE_2036_length_517_cov_56.799145_g1660_i0:27-494(+)
MGALARFVPALDNILKQLAQEQLPEQDFPLVPNRFQPPKPKAPAAPVAAPVAEAPAGLRRGAKKSWASEEAREQRDLDEVQLHSAHVVVFVLGGYTASENRVCHDLSQSLGRDIIIGGSCFLRPAQFIDNLSTLQQQQAAPSYAAAPRTSAIDIA